MGLILSEIRHTPIDYNKMKIIEPYSSFNLLEMPDKIEIEYEGITYNYLLEEK